MESSELALDASDRAAGRLAAPQDHPLAFWAANYADLFDVAGEAAPPPQDVGFLRARATTHYLLSEAQSPGLRLARSLETIGRGGFDGFAVRLTTKGRVSGRADEKFVACGPGDLLFLDFLEPLDLSLAPEGGAAADITLWFSRTRILGSIGADQALNGLFVPGASPAGATIGALMHALAGQAVSAPSHEFELLIDGFLALLAKVAPANPAVRAARGATNASFVTIRRHIDRNLRSPALSVDSLSKTFGISRAALYRLFEPIGGIAAYIRLARLRLAYRELVVDETGGKRIGIIAYQLGFKNVSAFNRAFRDAFGVSPGDARQKTSGGGAPFLLAQAAPGASEPALAARLKVLGQ